MPNVAFFAVVANNGKFYNGRAGDWNSNLTDNEREAFTYGLGAAERKAAQFNAFTAIHGFKFSVVEVKG